jgi:DNA-binding NarL/FixJ family response regulator
VDDPIRIAVVDDHALYTVGLGAVLGREPGFEVGWTKTTAVGLVERQASDRVDVIILDLNLGPEGTTLPLIPRLVAGPPQATVIAVSALADEQLVSAVQEAGAAGFVSKHVPFAELVAIIRRSQVSQAGFQRWPDQFEHRHPVQWGLSRRESDVLQHLTAGLSNREIANLLGVTVPTVNKQVQALYRKLGVSSRAQAVRLAVMGLRPRRPRPGGLVQGKSD